MSWTPTDAQVDATDAALFKYIWGAPRDEDRSPDTDDLEAARAVLVAVGPTIAAQALRDAANAADEDPEFRDPLRLKADWMRDRADTIEKEAGR